MEGQKRAKLAILVGLHGRGSNMASIAKACASQHVDAEIKIVIAQTPEVPALDTARNLGLPVTVVPSKQENYPLQLIEVLKQSEIDLICLAGYTRMLPSEVLQAYPGRVLNIHPALLPKFGGKGMYGINVHKAVIEAKESESGCTVHLVTEHYDEGAIILQKLCPVHESDSPETLAARVLELEHKAYPEAILKLWIKMNTGNA